MKQFTYFLAVALLATTIFTACDFENIWKNPVRTETITVDGVRFKMIEVTAGTFTMGANDGDTLSYDWDKPAHKVTLTKDYFIGETEVTQTLWEAVMGFKPTEGGVQWDETYGLGANRPAYSVSWRDIQEFLVKLNQKTGKTFRLPTEAEWEYAARGGSKSKGYLYSGGNDLNAVAWYYDNARKGLAIDDPNYGTHAVKTKQANELGLYDMSGNVWEWCNDWYADYTADPQTDPQGAETGFGRVIRGGCWHGNAQDCRVSYRISGAPGDRSSILGFRLARSSE